MYILIVEDEKKVAGFIKQGLQEERYTVDVAYDGEEALLLAGMNSYDLIVLDIMLPKKDGMEVLKDLRAQGLSIPILILTAKDTLEDKVQGLDSGADDYITKPFAFAELLARIRALLRRGKPTNETSLTAADLMLDPIQHKVQRGGKPIELTSKEYALLEYFLRNKGQVLTRTLINEHVWGYRFDTGTNIVDVYVNYLRSKIDRGFDKKLIHTVRGVGYVLREE
ncbi:response regulator transcription factor [bacterium]|nr:response regulator transcription factor [bacterium]